MKRSYGKKVRNAAPVEAAENETDSNVLTDALLRAIAREKVRREQLRRKGVRHAPEKHRHKETV